MPNPKTQLKCQLKCRLFLSHYKDKGKEKAVVSKILMCTGKIAVERRHLPEWTERTERR